MKSNFGLVPMPKYDEEQENYITYSNPISCFLTIPVTNPDMKRTGIIIDALTYDSYKNCLPIYYDITVSQKGLRNDDSIEMLEIVRDTRSTQVSNLYGITTKLNDKLQNVVLNGNGKAASTIAAAEPGGHFYFRELSRNAVGVVPVCALKTRKKVRGQS